MAAVAVTCACCSATVDWWVRLRSHPDLPICHDCLAGLDAQRDGQRELIAGSWAVRGFEPIFVVADMGRSTAWYERAGFEVSHHDATYAFARRERDLTVHLVQVADDQAAGHGALYLHCTDADAVAEGWRRAGIAVEGPLDQDHGRREGSAADPDGNVLRFGSPLR